ncbi:MAG TPA: hypothetical protein VKZ53_18470 [Candidatus Angelobacter sp.]|nr:hypothetical protein [Candidatus Angelobacter sp.]
MLNTFQKVYRVRLPDDELVMWRETLKDYSVEEFERAMKNLVKHPPKFDPGDGSLQVWRGMPKLPDVVGVMLEMREKAAAECRRRESERLAEEMRDLARRRAGGEIFYGIGDVLQNVDQNALLKTMPASGEARPRPQRKERAGTPMQSLKLMPLIESTMTEAEWRDRREMLRQQRAALLGNVGATPESQQNNVRTTR